MNKTKLMIMAAGLVLWLSPITGLQAQEDEGDECEDGGHLNLYELDEQTGSRYRKIGLTGRVLPDEKPQAKEESDQSPEETYVDGLTLNLNHNVTDLYIPVPGSDLALEVKRSVVAEGRKAILGGQLSAWNVEPGTLPNKPLGNCWDLPSLSACMISVTDEATDNQKRFSITDPSGASYEFLRLSGYGDTAKYFPNLANRHDKAIAGSKLEKQDGKFVLSLTHGTKLTYSGEYSFFKEPHSNRKTYYHYYRLEKVEDRYGNRLVYHYTDGSLVPGTVQVEYSDGSLGPKLTVEKNSVGKVTRVSDPKGNHVEYIYDPEDGLLAEVKYGTPSGGGELQSQYEYEKVTYAQVNPPPDNVSQTFLDAANSLIVRWNVAAMIDGLGRSYRFEYTEPASAIVPPTSVAAKHQIVKKITLPDGKEVKFEQHANLRIWPVRVIEQPDGSRIYQGSTRANAVIDAEGNATAFEFGLAEPSRAVYALPVMYYPEWKIHYYRGGELEFKEETVGVEVNGYKALRYVVSPKGSTEELGSETFEFDFFAGNALKAATDFAGNRTEYKHGEAWEDELRQANSGLYYGFIEGVNLYYEDPTEQVNALGDVKKFEYEESYRLMKKVTDEVGRVTEYEFDSLGNRTKETIKAADGNVAQVTEFAYGDSVHKAFMTFKRVKCLEDGGSPAWLKDLETQYVPDSQGRVWKEIVDPSGLALTTETQYDANNNKISVKDPRGNTTRFEYDGRNRLVKVIYPKGNPNDPDAIKELAYDARGNKIRETDENGNSTLFVYDSLNRLQKQARDMNANGQVDSGDLVTEFGYNGCNSKVYQIDPQQNKNSRGHTLTMEYDALQRLVKTTDALNKATTLVYGENSGGSVFDVSGFKPTESVDPLGYKTTVTYDKLYRPARQELQYGSSSQTAVSESAYDKVGNVLSKTVYTGDMVSIGLTTGYQYDALNRKIKITLPDGSEQRVVYTSTGLTWKQFDELDRENETEYDAAGRPVLQRGPEVFTGWGNGTSRPETRTIYDAAGNVAATINPLGNRWDFTYDPRNRKVKEQQPSVTDAGNGAASRPTLTTKYDGAGNVLEVTDARGHTTKTEYDRANRPVKMTAPEVATANGGSAAPVTVSEYDHNGNVVKLTDANGHATANEYDKLNRLIKTTDAAGLVVRNEYDAAGNRTAVIDGKNQRTEFGYDGLKRNTFIKDPADKREQFAYNALYKTRRTDQQNLKTDYAYDSRGRLLGVSYQSADKTVNSDRGYTYDAAGNLLSVSEPGKSGKAEVAYSYDNLNRQLTESSGGLTHQYRYDLAGNRIAVNYGGTGRMLACGYDALNRLELMQEMGAGVPVRTSAYGYDLNGNIVKLTLPNGDVVGKQYDALNRVHSIETKTQGTLLLSKYEQEYDLVGNVTKVTESYANGGLNNRTISNEYDQINRLTRETISGGADTQYVYDQAHNRTQKVVSGGTNAGTTTYSYNNLNQLTAANGQFSASYSYDANGNRKTRTVGGVTDNYSYDQENRLVKLIKQTAGGGGIYRYAYDYRTRRVERTEPGSTAKIIFSGGVSVQEYSVGTNDPLVEYVRGSDYGGGVGGILYTLRSGIPSYTHYNSRGDVVAKTNAAGVPTYQAQYEAFGTRTAEQGATQDRQKANTKDEDPTGLLNEGFRYRDLETGAFITRDPLGFVDGPNMYSYVVDNPWSKFDPHGLSEEEVHQAVAQGLAQTPQPFRGIAQFVGADKALTSALVKADAKMTSQGKLSGTDKALLTLEGGAPAVTAAVLAPAAAAGPVVFAKEAIGEATGLPIGIDDAAKLLKNADNLLKSAKDVAQEGKAATETVERVMSKAEAIATKETGLVRGGREGTHYVTDAANSDALRARQRLALDSTPEVKATLEVPKGAFSQPTKVQPANNMPGGGMERKATGNIPAKIVKEEKLK